MLPRESGTEALAFSWSPSAHLAGEGIQRDDSGNSLVPKIPECLTFSNCPWPIPSLQGASLGIRLQHGALPRGMSRNISSTNSTWFKSFRCQEQRWI